MPTFSDAKSLSAAALGGRVAHTGFLEPDDAASLAAQLRNMNAEIGVHVSGGFPGARRRVVTVFPDTIPEATTPIAAVYAEGAHDADEFRVALKSVAESEEIGDIVQHRDGLSVFVLEAAKTSLPETLRVKGVTVSLDEVPIDKVTSGSHKRQLVIVPSLRVDALGAKAFNVSRSYFSKGISAGNVTLNGTKATKSSSAEAGDEVYAEGLGRFSISSVQGETRRGNLKVNIEIEKV